MKTKLIFITLTILFITLCYSFGEANKQKQFKQLYKGNHKKIDFQLLSNTDTNSLCLRIFEKDIPYSVHEYLSFKAEPYLSTSIAVICNADTMRPVATTMERTFEAGNEIIYLMIFNGNVDRRCDGKKMVINDFLGLGDTLTIKIKAHL